MDDDCRCNTIAIFLRKTTELECDCRGVNFELLLAAGISDLHPIPFSLGRKISFAKRKGVAAPRFFAFGVM